MYYKFMELNVGRFTEQGWKLEWTYGYVRFKDVVFKVESTDHGDLYIFKTYEDFVRLMEVVA